MVRLLVSKVSAKSSARCQPLPCNSRIIANRRSVLFIEILFLFSCPRTRDVKTPLAAIIAQTIPRGNLHCLQYTAILVPRPEQSHTFCSCLQTTAERVPYWIIQGLRSVPASIPKEGKRRPFVDAW